MEKEFRTIRVWKKTWQKLRLLAALTSQTMVKTLDILIDRELENVGSQRTQDSASAK